MIVIELQLALFYNGLASHYHNCMDYTRALECCERAMALSKEIDDVIQHCRALFWIANIQYRLGNYSEGLRKGIEAQKLAKRRGNFALEADCMRTQTLCCIALGNFEYAAALCAEARELLAACGLDGSGPDLLLLNSEAEIRFYKTEYDDSRRIHLSTARITSADWHALDRAYALVNIATIDVTIGVKDDEVHQTLDEARHLFTINSYARGICNCDVILADLLFRGGQRDEAQVLYQRSLSMSLGRDVELPLMCFERLGDVAYAQGNITAAFYHRMAYFAYTRKTQSMAATYQALRCLGDIFMAQADSETALSLYRLALDGFTAMDIHRGRGDCKFRIGDIMERRGNVDVAQELWREAKPLFERSSQFVDVSLCDKRLMQGLRR